ncbi:helix-turn-helix domain-containing protein [Pseudomonas sp. LABIM340]|uniref:TetR/AcrR family transcriptional regulator n=1 Tax=Pseudomonas sp. LABIM340 TaxID=3156585 RepID=UPI0032AEEEDD
MESTFVRRPHNKNQSCNRAFASVVLFKLSPEESHPMKATKSSVTLLPERSTSRLHRNRSKALALFASRGFAQVSVRELAHHLDLTAGSYYHHYESKEDLLLEFICEHYAALLSLFDELPRRASREAVLGKLTQRLISLHESSPFHFQLAARDLDCLKPSQRLQVEMLRDQLREQIDSVIHAFSPPGSRPIATPALELFEHLPIWMKQYAASEKIRCETLSRLLSVA